MKIATFAAVIVLLASAGLCEETQLSKLPDFSATEVRGGGSHQMAWKIYHSGNMLRLDMSPAAAAIFEPAADKVYHLLILPDKTTCIEMPANKSQVIPSPLETVFNGKMEITPAGGETIDGRSYTVETIVTTTPKGETINSKIWLADDPKGVPVKIELYVGKQTLTTTYRDIKAGTPDAKLFKPEMKCIPEDKAYQIAPSPAPNAPPK